MTAYSHSPEKRCTACQNCRRLKVKCELSDPSDPTSPCLRCLKRKKECNYESRKRKIDEVETTTNGVSPYNMDTSNSETATAIQTPQSSSHIKGAQMFKLYQLESIPRLNVSSISINRIRDSLMIIWQDLSNTEANQNKLLDDAAKLGSISYENNAMKMGLITEEDAARRLFIYKTELSPVFPVVPIPQSTTVQDFLRDAPLLFHVVMSVASALSTPSSLPNSAKQVDNNFLLHNVTYQTLIQETFIKGHKTVELIKCFLIMLAWFNDPHFYHKKKVQLVFATTLALAYDCGLGIKRPAPSSGGIIKNNFLESIVQPHLVEDNTTLECANLWVGLYTYSFNTVSSFTTRVPMTWSSYLEECVTVLEKRGDLRLVVAARYTHLLEKINEELTKRNNQPTALDIEDSSVQYLITHMGEEIEKVHDRYLNSQFQFEDVIYNAAKAHLHQVVLYCSFNPKLGRASFSVHSLNIERAELSHFAIQSFRACYESAMACVNCVLGYSSKKIVSCVLPLVHQIFYCAVTIVKCRILCIFNKYYYDAYPVSEEATDTVAKLTAFLDKSVQEYPTAKGLITISFIIKVVLCRCDSIVQSALKERSYNSLDIEKFVPQDNNEPSPQQPSFVQRAQKMTVPGNGTQKMPPLPIYPNNSAYQPNSQYPFLQQSPNNFVQDMSMNSMGPQVMPVQSAPAGSMNNSPRFDHEDPVIAPKAEIYPTNERKSSLDASNELWNFAEDFIWNDTAIPTDGFLGFDF